MKVGQVFGGNEFFIVLVHLQTVAESQKIGDAGAVNVHVQYAHAEALQRQGGGNIHRYGALAHSALAAHDEKRILDVPQGLADGRILLGEAVRSPAFRATARAA